MILKMTYSADDGQFSMGELRALITQQANLPDEVPVALEPGLIPGKVDDSITIIWDEA